MRKLIGKVIPCFILLSFCCIQQVNSQFIWPEKDFTYKAWISTPEFKVIEIPEKWKDESVVVIAEKFQYYLVSDYKNLFSHRRRIKLQDKAAVEAFSIFYSNMNLGMRIYESNGAYDDAELKSVKSGDIMKHAVVDLEVGDIIDFHTTGKLPYDMYRSLVETDIVCLNGKYPTISLEYEFILSKSFFLNYSTNDTTSKITEKLYNADNLGFNMADMSFKSEITDDKGKADVYQLIFKASDLDKARADRFNAPYQTEPIFKYKVYRSGQTDDNDPYNAEPFTPLNKGPEWDKIAKYLLLKLSPSKKTSLYKSITEYVVKEHGVKKPQPSVQEMKEEVKSIFYAYRQQLYSKNNKELLKYGFDDNKFDHEAPGNYGDDIRSPLSLKEAKELLRIIKERGITCDIITTVPRDKCTLDKTIMIEELSYAVRITFTQNDRWYITGIGRYSEVGNGNCMLEGTEGLILDIESSVNNIKYEKISIPISDAKSNIAYNIIELEVSDDLNTSKIKNTNRYFGSMKLAESNKRLFISDYCHHEGKTFEKNYSEIPDDIPSKQKVAFVNLQESKAKVKEEERLKIYTELCESKYDGLEVNNYDTLALINLGRKQGEPLEFIEHYELNGLIQKAGQNYFFNIEKLISDKIQLKKNEYNREVDIYIDFPKTYVNEITITIPDGYKVENLDALNVSIDNESGAFIATAKEEDGKIIINTSKVYKKNYLPKEKWKLMTEFLDAAYNYTQQKIIFKKG